MAYGELLIVNKEFRERLSLYGGTVTTHPVSASTYKKYPDLEFVEFSLVEYPSVKCLPTLKNHTDFEICFRIKVLLTNEYKVSLYYFQRPSELIHVRSVHMCQISDLSVCKMVIPNLTSKDVNLISQSYFLCTEICRKDVPYIFARTPSILDASKMTNCSSLFENIALANFKIVVGAREFLIHKEILAAKSPVFLAALKSEMKGKKENQMIVEDVDANVFQEILRYIYSNTVKELRTHAEKLLKAADKYDIPKLKSLCAEELSRSLNIENAEYVLELADLCHEKTLEESALKFIQNNVEQILQTENDKTWCQRAPRNLMADTLATVVSSIKSSSGAPLNNLM